MKTFYGIPANAELQGLETMDTAVVIDSNGDIRNANEFPDKEVWAHSLYVRIKSENLPKGILHCIADCDTQRECDELKEFFFALCSLAKKSGVESVSKNQ